LVLRLYAIGMAQLALVVAATVAIAIGMTKLRPIGDLRGLRTQIEPIAHDRARLAQALQRIGKREGGRLTVYDDAHAVVASNAKPPLPLPHWSDPSRGPDRPPFPPPGSSLAPGPAGSRAACSRWKAPDARLWPPG